MLADVETTVAPPTPLRARSERKGQEACRSSAPVQTAAACAATILASDKTMARAVGRKRRRLRSATREPPGGYEDPLQFPASDRRPRHRHDRNAGGSGPAGPRA